MPDEKRKKFVQLAESRTQAALNEIRKIGNLSNRRAYTFDDADVRKIVRALKEATADLERKFSSVQEDSAPQFKL